MTSLFIVPLAALVLAAVLTRVFLGWVEARDIAAEENHRSMHKGRVPTGGGLPLLASALLVALAAAGAPEGLHMLAPALAALVLVSWADDRKAVPPLARLAVHIGVAMAALSALPGHLFVFQGVLPFWIDRAVAGLALVWFINLYNFMDGIDGIAGIETVVIAVGYAVVLLAAGHASEPLVAVALAVAGATAGFLVWNWHPARIIMGDVGAVPLGFLMGWLMLDLATRFSLAAGLILPLYFAADATITLGRRVVRGERPWEAHREHFYQRAAGGLGSHARVVERVLACGLALIGCAVLGLSAPWAGLALAAVLVALLLLGLSEAGQEGPPSE